MGNLGGREGGRDDECQGGLQVFHCWGAKGAPAPPTEKLSDPSEAPPEDTINSLTALDAHERPLFIKLRGTVVSRRVFIRSQSLIAS